MEDKHPEFIKEEGKLKRVLEYAYFVLGMILVLPFLGMYYMVGHKFELNRKHGRHRYYNRR